MTTHLDAFPTHATTLGAALSKTLHWVPCHGVRVRPKELGIALQRVAEVAERALSRCKAAPGKVGRCGGGGGALARAR